MPPRTLQVPVPANGKRTTITVPDSGGAQRPAGALQLELHARPYDVMDWNGTMCRQSVLTVMPEHVLMSEIEIITDVGLAAPGKGPKLLFLRALTTLLTAGAKEMPLGDAADPYLTGLCYFNALRELGGARRIVEDEMRAKLADYGTRRRRLNPSDQPFENRELREVLELTSRESTDKVAAARDALARSALAGC